MGGRGGHQPPVSPEQRDCLRRIVGPDDDSSIDGVYGRAERGRRLRSVLPIPPLSYQTLRNPELEFSVKSIRFRHPGNPGHGDSMICATRSIDDDAGIHLVHEIVAYRARHGHPVSDRVYAAAHWMPTHYWRSISLETKRASRARLVPGSECRFSGLVDAFARRGFLRVLHGHFNLRAGNSMFRTMAAVRRAVQRRPVFAVPAAFLQSMRAFVLSCCRATALPNELVLLVVTMCRTTWWEFGGDGGRAVPKPDLTERDAAAIRQAAAANSVGAGHAAYWVRHRVRDLALPSYPSLRFK